MNQILVHEKIIVTPEFKRKKKMYKLNFFLSVFLLCTLFSCYIYAEYDRNVSEQVSKEILMGLKETEEEGEETQIDNTTISADNGIIYVTLLSSTPEENYSASTVTNAQSTLNTTKQNSLQNIETKSTHQPETKSKSNLKIVESIAEDGTRYYSEAILKIDSLDIEYPVLSDTSEELLKISLNKIWGPNPNEVGNYCIAGHNYKSGKMFGKLKMIKLGDTFTLEDLLGNKLTYEVYDKYIVEPDDVSCTTQYTDGRREVTLITCQNSGRQRLVVRAKEVE